MKILVINCGSSSLKYQLFNMRLKNLLAKGLIERIGRKGCLCHYHPQGRLEIEEKKRVTTYKAAIKVMIKFLTSEQHGVIKSVKEIKAIGHRVVHGGEKFTASIIINKTVKKNIKEYARLAPLHNSHNLEGILASESLFPRIPQVAVFDTAFHQTIPPYAYLYGLPMELYRKDKVRRYGFHGTSHKFISLRTAELLKKPLNTLKLISCHLGNGCSMTAIKDGKSIDTSMGLTPLEGLIMGTRCGDIDPGVIFYLMEKERLGLKKINRLLNEKSGLLGLSDISNDMRDIYKASIEGNEQAELALKIFVYRIKKYIGSYAAVMDGLNVLIFTAGIGENQEKIRELICKNMDFLGIKIDKGKNEAGFPRERIISSPDSKVIVLVVPTNEELRIAQETFELVKS